MTSARRGAIFLRVSSDRIGDANAPRFGPSGVVAFETLQRKHHRSADGERQEVRPNDDREDGLPPRKFRERNSEEPTGEPQHSGEAALRGARSSNDFGHGLLPFRPRPGQAHSIAATALGREMRPRATSGTPRTGGAPRQRSRSECCNVRTTRRYRPPVLLTKTSGYVPGSCQAVRR
jgi:hypothetical protein